MYSPFSVSTAVGAATIAIATIATAVGAAIATIATAVSTATIAIATAVSTAIATAVPFSIGFDLGFSFELGTGGKDGAECKRSEEFHWKDLVFVNLYSKLSETCRLIRLCIA